VKKINNFFTVLITYCLILYVLPSLYMSAYTIGRNVSTHEKDWLCAFIAQLFFLHDALYCDFTDSRLTSTLRRSKLNHNNVFLLHWIFGNFFFFHSANHSAWSLFGLLMHLTWKLLTGSLKAHLSLHAFLIPKSFSESLRWFSGVEGRTHDVCRTDYSVFPG
jgi:hypothetical protein